jgi:predicted nucleotidyltransferase
LDNLQDKVIVVIVEIARKYPSVKKIILFGSRARGDNSPKSDYDLAIVWEKIDQENASLWGSFACALRESNPTLNSFDLINLSEAQDSLYSTIEREGIVVYDKN